MSERDRAHAEALAWELYGIGAGQSANTSSVSELLARALTMGTSGRFIILTTDPQATPEVTGYGPFDGQEAVTKAGKLQDSYKTTADMSPGDNLMDVTVTIVPWLEWES